MRLQVKTGCGKLKLGKCLRWSHRLDGHRRVCMRKTNHISRLPSPPPQLRAESYPDHMSCRFSNKAKVNLHYGGIGDSVNEISPPSASVCPFKVPLSNSLLTFCTLGRIRGQLEAQIKLLSFSTTLEQTGQIFNMQYMRDEYNRNATGCPINAVFKTYDTRV